MPNISLEYELAMGWVSLWTTWQQLALSASELCFWLRRAIEVTEVSSQRKLAMKAYNISYCSPNFFCPTSLFPRRTAVSYL